MAETAEHKEPAGISRRRLIEDGARLAAGVCVAGLGLGLVAARAPVQAATALRPPGALPEVDFLGACVRCGQCVRDCPYDTLKLADLGGPAASGTPYFEARAIPCEMCDDIPCVKACPTGALDPKLTVIEQAKMGVAVLVGTETCLNFNGLRCDVCYRVCPVIDKAITLEVSHNTRTGKHAVFVPTVHSAACTGCGKCEKSCVLEEAAIKVLPLSLAALKDDAHYRRGWEEKARHGGRELVPGVIDLPDRMPALPGPESLK